MENNEVSKTISEITEYIEQHIRSRLTLECIAEYSAFSKYHLHRVFRAITGTSLMEYVRARQLAHTLKELLTTDLRMIDIAMEFGFSHEQSFTRAFKKTFGITPSEYRKTKPEIEITDKIDLNLIRFVGPGIVFGPRIVILPEFFAIGTQYQINLQNTVENRPSHEIISDFFYKQRRKIKNSVNPHQFLGIERYFSEACTYCHYTPALQVSDLKQIPHGMVGDRIPTSTYAIFRYIGSTRPENISPQHLEELMKYGHDWIDHSHYLWNEQYIIERFDYSIARDDYCEIEICVPVLTQS